MVSLEGIRTDANLKQAVSDAARFDRFYLGLEQAADAAGCRDLAALSRAAAQSGARYASGHVDYLVTDRRPPEASPTEIAATMTAMIDDRAAMYAGMVRTEHDEGFEGTADWFETLVKAGRSRTGRLRRALDKAR